MPNLTTACAVIIAVILLIPVPAEALPKPTGYGAASDAAASDHLGTSVAAAGNLIVSGAPEHDTAGLADSGAAYVFQRSGKNWVQVAKLTAAEPSEGARFGASVAIAGTTIVVGAPHHFNGHMSPSIGGEASGLVYVFEKVGKAWQQSATLRASDDAEGDQFGAAVAIVAKTVVVGSPRADRVVGGADAGAAYVFQKTGKVWSQQAKLLASNPTKGATFGFAIAMAGTSILIGAPDRGVTLDGYASAVGRAYVFVKAGTAWEQQARLEWASAGTSMGPTVRFAGHAVAIQGTTAVLGMPTDGAGGAAVFQKVGAGWVQKQWLSAKATDYPANHFGSSVAVSGSTVYVGSPHDRHVNNNDGTVHVFQKSGTKWVDKASLGANDGHPGARFGTAIALAGTALVVGSPGHTKGEVWQGGAVHSFQ